MIADIILSLIFSLLIGSGLGYFLFKQARSKYLEKTQEEGQDLVQETKDTAELKALEEQERIQEIEMQLWTKVENEMLKLEERIEDLESQVEEKKTRNEEAFKTQKETLDKKTNDFKSYEGQVRSKDQMVQKKRTEIKQINENYVQLLSEKTQWPKQEALEKISQELITETQRQCAQWIEDTEEETKTHVEPKAKRILGLALDRFARPFCPERGIGAVNFPDPQSRKNFCDPKGMNAKTVTSLCGCDLIIEDGMDMIGVSGFDPVRRELTRRTLERILKEKKAITPEVITRIAENQKRELFRQIKNDGDNLAKELKLEGLHPEVRQMMGSLRYRYSFTQNQYFHCAEVGWLAGLLASELQIDIRKARRVGMLHDIGKAMDHQLDGGHAVIGANFIETRNEAADVVHAVKAHHYDEQPSTDHAFLVIAADAISGARPGARRSTMESYTQKITEMQEIARSFEGVTDCFILSGGRECRVLVNGRKVDDSNALQLSKKIAHKIEEDCSYPGQIKVVVVRETVVVEQTRKEG